MSSTLDEKMAELTPERRAKVEEQAAELVREEARRSPAFLSLKLAQCGFWSSVRSVGGDAAQAVRHYHLMRAHTRTTGWPRSRLLVVRGWRIRREIAAAKREAA